MTGLMSPVDAEEHEAIMQEAMVNEVSLWKWRHHRWVAFAIMEGAIVAFLVYGHAKVWLLSVLG